MESASVVWRLRHWWALHEPPFKRPSPTRFFVWLAFFAASGAAFLMLSQGWFQVGFLLLITGNLVLHGFSPQREYPAAKLTSREILLFAAAVLATGALILLAENGPYTLPFPTPSPPVTRVAIVIFWIAVVAYEWRRTFASSPRQSTT